MTHFTLDDIITGEYRSIGLLVHLLNQLKDRLLNEHLVPLDLTAQQFKVMLLVYREKTQLCKDLSQALCIDAGATSRICDRLEKKGLLVRERDEQDRRRVQLKMTDEGVNLCQKSPQLIINALNEFTQGLSEDEITMLMELMTKLLKANGALPT
ncbi:MarR family transcriptional regulator [Celerinatantimonas diazotrophica]|uniref:DNA-binding MarR family transcriptional regulator n=1 Tax=Celerinatantimonas diazotrophica TaxID=412034 RepID=A0A4R1K7L6_9GAMM|nr:MarR family transcriptional regulator [Celerinatantimonas diazotrophica]TCK59059.1 DNA-binding MarR family transcriptional regulator [Celerinatantimonas diazotrophica]CAG9297694.1 Multiple antibiotic resistance protein MarR [Celerinatantimonas diazotrophica]